MNTLTQTTETFTALNSVVKQTLAGIISTLSDPHHSHAFRAARYLHGLVDEDRLSFSLHNRYFEIVPRYYIMSRTAGLMTYEVMDDELTDRKRRVHLEHADFILNEKGLENHRTEDSIGAEYVKVLLDALYD